MTDSISDELVNCEMLAEQFIEQVGIARQELERGNLMAAVKMLKLLEMDMEEVLAIGDAMNAQLGASTVLH